MADLPAVLVVHYEVRARINLLKKYGEYLLHNNIVDSKQACFENIGKIISEAMDNGDCSISTIEEVKQYIEAQSLLSKEDQKAYKKEDMIKGILCSSTVDLTDDILENVPEELKNNLSEYKRMKAAIRVMRERIENNFSEVAENAIRVFMAKYAKLFAPEFLKDYSN